MVPVRAGDEVVAYAPADKVGELIRLWLAHGDQPPWDVRGRFSAEVRAGAESIVRFGVIVTITAEEPRGPGARPIAR